MQYYQGNLVRTGGLVTNEGDSLMQEMDDYPPQMEETDENIQVVTQEDYFAEVFSAQQSQIEIMSTLTETPFNVVNYRVNPGVTSAQGGIFNWIPSMAQGYTEYDFEQLQIIFEPTISSNTNKDSALGVVMIACEYDNTVPTYGDKKEMLQSEWAISGKSNEKIVFNVRAERAQQRHSWMDIRYGAPEPAQDLNLYDWCNLFVATQGQQSFGMQLGRLKARYTVRFTKTIQPPTGSMVQSARLTWAGIQSSPNSVNENCLLGKYNNGPTLTPNSTLNMSVDVESGNVIQFPKELNGGIFLFILNIQGDAIANVHFDPAAFSFDNCQIYTIAGSLNSPVSGISSGTNAGVVLQTVGVVKVLGRNARIIYNPLPGTVFPKYVYTSQLIVTEINGNAIPEINAPLQYTPF